MNLNEWKALEYARDGMFVSKELTEEMLDGVKPNKGSEVLVLFSYEMLDVLYERGYKNVMLAHDNIKTFMRNFASKYDYKVVDVSEIRMKKFDVIIGNPPFNGKSALHQKFFNWGVNILKDEGTISFIQPDSAYTSKKEVQKKSNREMMHNIRQYRTKVNFVEGNVFKNASVATSLSITHLTKIIDHSIEVTYNNGDHYEHIPLSEINKLGVEPKLYSTLKSKIETYISKHGSLHDISHNCMKNNVVCYKLSKIRGHVNSEDFYTIVSRDNSFHNVVESKFGLLIDECQKDSLYSYLTSFIARYALSIYKTNINNHMGELKIVPRVPFDRVWNDGLLVKEIGISEDELNEIYKILPDYYNILK